MNGGFDQGNLCNWLDISNSGATKAFPTGPNGYYLEGTAGPGKYVIFQQDMKVKIGESYVLSLSYMVDAAASAQASRLDFEVAQYDPAGGSSWIYFTTSMIQGAVGTWRTATSAARTFTACSVTLRVYMDGSSTTSNVKMMVDNIQVTQTTGNRAVSC